MRFKDKAGYVFRDIVKVHSGFCRGRRCHECVMNRPGMPQDCVSFAKAHPAEAARLMGYEVVADEEKVDPVTDRHPSKEADMDKQKPRICEVLGVEVGERFKVRGFVPRYYIDDVGRMVHDEGFAVPRAIFRAINRPDHIIRQPRAEEKEIEMTGGTIA